jgi:hypothetical protein
VKRLSPALLALAACAFEPTGGEPLNPPQEYRELWAEALACTGRVGDFTDLRFTVIEGDCFDTPKGCAAGWTDGNHITLASGWKDHPMIVKHEMIHTLIGDGHPAVPFETPCKATWDSWDGYVVAGGGLY